MHWKQRCLDTNVKQWVVFDETSAKKKGIISLDYSQNNSKDTRILTIYIYTKRFKYFENNNYSCLGRNV